MNGLLAPLAFPSLSLAAGMYAGFSVSLFVVHRMLRGSAPFASSASRRAPFLAASVAVAALTLTFPFSLRPVLAEVGSLAVVASVAAVVLAVLIHTGLPREGRGLATFWMGSAKAGAFFGVAAASFARHLSWLSVGLLNAAFAYAQYDKYGFVTPQMGLYVVCWWGYLFVLFSMERTPLFAWDRGFSDPGLLSLWARLVLVPIGYSLGGWELIDKVMWTPPLWKILGMASAYTVGLLALCAAKEERVQSAAEVWILGCIALTTGFSVPTPYLMPIFALLFGGYRLLREGPGGAAEVPAP